MEGITCGSDAHQACAIVADSELEAEFVGHGQGNTTSAFEHQIRHSSRMLLPQATILSCYVVARSARRCLDSCTAGAALTPEGAKSLTTTP